MFVNNASFRGDLTKVCFFEQTLQAKSNICE